MFKRLASTYNSLVYKDYILVLKDYSEKRRQECKLLKVDYESLKGYNALDIKKVFILECIVQEMLKEFSKTTSTIEGLFQLSKLALIDAIKLSKSSAFGNVLLVERFINLRSKELFVLKYAKDDSIITVLHETVIGLLLNELRKITPTFTYVFGGFFCSVQEQKYTKNVDLCRIDSPTNFLMLNEKINGESFYSWAERKPTECNGIALLKIVIQILFALSVAQQKFNFSHNDLHGENIMIEDIGFYNKYSYSIVTSAGHKTVQVSLRYLPKIIDYGLSRANVKYKKVDADYFNLRSGPKQKSEFEKKLANLSDCIKSFGSDSVLCIKDENKDYCPLFDIIQLWMNCCIVSSNIDNFEVLRPFADALFGGNITYNTYWMNRLCEQYEHTRSQPLETFVNGYMKETFMRRGATSNVFHISKLNQKEKFNTANAKKVLNLILFDSVGRIKDDIKKILETNDEDTCITYDFKDFIKKEETLEEKSNLLHEWLNEFKEKKMKL